MGKKPLAATISGFDHSTESSRYSSAGITAHIRGWDDGIRVTAYLNSEGRPVYEIHTTGGSNDPEVKVKIATVRPDEISTGLGSLDR